MIKDSVYLAIHLFPFQSHAKLSYYALSFSSKDNKKFSFPFTLIMKFKCVNLTDNFLSINFFHL